MTDNITKKQFNINELNWHSDYSGYEVGYEDISSVGEFTTVDGKYSLYINNETNDVVEVFEIEEEDEYDKQILNKDSK